MDETFVQIMCLVSFLAGRICFLAYSSGYGRFGFIGQIAGSQMGSLMDLSLLFYWLCALMDGLILSRNGGRNVSNGMEKVCRNEFRLRAV